MAKVGGNAKATATKKEETKQVSPAPAPEVKVEASKTLAPEVKKEESKKEEPKQDTPANTQGQQAPEVKKETKVLEPKAWQRIDASDPNKPKLVDQLTFLGEKMDYEPGFRAEYDWNNLDNSDGLKRVVTAKFPKANRPDGVDVVDIMGYKLTIEKYGNSAVCKLEGPWTTEDAEGNEVQHQNYTILEYVSLATVIDVLQDLLNPKDDDGNGTCTIPWGTIDQVIKKKRNLKSRIKNLGENDLPARSQRGKKETTAEPAKTEENAGEWAQA